MRSRTGDSPFGEAVRDAFHWKKRAIGGLAPPSAPTGIQADHVASGFSEFPARTKSDSAAPAGTCPSQRRRPNVDRREASFTADVNVPGGGFPAPGLRIPAAPIVTTANPDPTAGTASASFSPVDATRRTRLSFHSYTRPREPVAMRSAPFASSRRPRIDSSGKSQPGSTKPSG